MIPGANDLTRSSLTLGHRVERSNSPRRDAAVDHVNAAGAKGAVRAGEKKHQIGHFHGVAVAFHRGVRSVWIRGPLFVCQVHLFFNHHHYAGVNRGGIDADITRCVFLAPPPA